MNDAVPQQLYAVLVALQSDTLLLPNLAVAEVVAMQNLRPLSGSPAWFAGLLSWQGLELPVARFELLNNGGADLPGRRTRIAIINAVSTRLSAGRYGLLAEGYPHLVTLNRAALRPAELRPQDSPGLVLSRVKVASQEALIPNLERIEQEMAAVLSEAPG
ncbi:MAG: chemotaxis protein CheW [Nevskia sp.]|nr:chemotaxis protein CheW [Nevskia sp.]